MLTFSRILLYLFLGLACLSSVAISDEPTVHLNGTVHDTTGRVIQNAHVTISSLESLAKPIELVTDAAGSFQISVPVGQYVVTISRVGYESQSKQVQIDTRSFPSLSFEMTVLKDKQS